MLQGGRVEIQFRQYNWAWCCHSMHLRETNVNYMIPFLRWRWRIAFWDDWKWYGIQVSSRLIICMVASYINTTNQLLPMWWGNYLFLSFVSNFILCSKYWYLMWILIHDLSTIIYFLIMLNHLQISFTASYSQCNNDIICSLPENCLMLNRKPWMLLGYDDES